MCFTLAARKKLTVKQALVNGRWMIGLQNMTSNDQLRQFVWSLDNGSAGYASGGGVRYYHLDSN
jgi:hypothetical protein